MKFPIPSLLCALALPTLGAPALAGDTFLHVISTTDLHGRLLAQKAAGNELIGGVDVMAGYFNIAKEADPESILLDSGDLFQGTIISNASDGATVVRWMNYAGYTAAAIGNHDFDFGPGEGRNVVVNPELDPQEALKKREGEASFKFLSANICSIDEDPNHCASDDYPAASFTTPYLIKNVHGVRVGIIGLSTPDTPSTTLPVNVAKLRFGGLVGALERNVPKMKAEGAELIVLVMHDGGFCKDGKCNPQDHVFKMIDQLKPSTRQAISLVLAGHTHSYVNTDYTGVRVVISGAYGKSFGYTTLRVRADRTAEVEETRMVDFCRNTFSDTNTCTSGKGSVQPATFLGRSITPDAGATSLIAGDIQHANAVASRIVGKLLAPLTFQSPESSLGDMMADAFRACLDRDCAKPAVDIAFQNTMGIRAPLLEAGPVTYGQIFEVSPFDNFYAVVTLSGRQIWDLLSATYGGEFNNLMQVSGVKVVINTSAPRERVITNPAGESSTILDPVVSVQTPDGKPLELDRSYRVALSDFLAQGGSGATKVLKGLRPAPEIHYERNLRDAIVDYLGSNPEGWDYSNRIGRITTTR